MEAAHLLQFRSGRKTVNVVTKAKREAKVGAGSPLILNVAGPQEVPIGNRGGVIEHLFAGAGVQTSLEIRITVRNLLVRVKERPWLQKQVGHRCSWPERWSIEGRGAKEALRAKNPEPRTEQGNLGAGPDRLYFA